jgi:hypothetical protein
VLFLEKEGFLPLLEHAQLAERYDLALMSTKGVSNTAARQLVDEMCGRYRIPLLVLHDFDKAGFSIIGTLRRSNRRYAFRNRLKVVDLGLRLADVENLESEDVFDRDSRESIRQNLRGNGATPDEIEFLLEQRVELNAFPSDELVAFIRRKLDGCGIKKIVPPNGRLTETYKLLVRGAEIEESIRTVVKRERKIPIDIPADLQEQVREHLTTHPEDPWEIAVREIARIATGGSTIRRHRTGGGRR